MKNKDLIKTQYVFDFELTEPEMYKAMKKAGFIRLQIYLLTVTTMTEYYFEDGTVTTSLREFRKKVYGE